MHKGTKYPNNYGTTWVSIWCNCLLNMSNIFADISIFFANFGTKSVLIDFPGKIYSLLCVVEKQILCDPYVCYFLYTKQQQQSVYRTFSLSPSFIENRKRDKIESLPIESRRGVVDGEVFCSRYSCEIMTRPDWQHQTEIRDVYHSGTLWSHFVVLHNRKNQ